MEKIIKRIAEYESQLKMLDVIRPIAKEYKDRGLMINKRLETKIKEVFKDRFSVYMEKKDYGKDNFSLTISDRAMSYEDRMTIYFGYGIDSKQLLDAVEESIAWKMAKLGQLNYEKMEFSNVKAKYEKVSLAYKAEMKAITDQFGTPDSTYKNIKELSYELKEDIGWKEIN